MSTENEAIVKGWSDSVPCRVPDPWKIQEQSTQVIHKSSHRVALINRTQAKALEFVIVFIVYQSTAFRV